MLRLLHATGRQSFAGATYRELEAENAALEETVRSLTEVNLRLYSALVRHAGAHVALQVAKGEVRE